MIESMDQDKPRFLHRSSEHGYTDQPALALRNEPEALSRQAQSELAEATRVRSRGEWAASRGRLLAELDTIAGKPWSVMVKRELKTARRFIDQIGVELERELKQLDSRPRRGVSSS